MTDQATDQSVFNDDGTATHTEPAKTDVQSPTFTIPDPVKELIGEGAKYSDVTKALESIPHSQAHIRTLEEENARLRQETAKADAMKELIEQMKSGQTQNQDPVQPVVDSSEVAKEAVNLIHQQEVQKTRAANELKASQAMKEVYGDNAVKVLNAKAEELGMSVDALRNVAMDSPEAFLKLVGDTKQSGPAQPTQKTSNFVPQGTQQPQRKERLLSTPSSTADFVNEWRRVKAMVGPGE